MIKYPVTFLIAILLNTIVITFMRTYIYMGMLWYFVIGIIVNEITMRVIINNNRLVSKLHILTKIILVVTWVGFIYYIFMPAIFAKGENDV